jgi:DNA modification methylase
MDQLREQLALYFADFDDQSLLEQELNTLQDSIPEKTNGDSKGRYDARNSLNDLTGAEWVFFLNSVETTAYPTKGPESFAHDIRKIHPSPKPPQLMRKMIQFFTKKGGWVLDPFMGVGGTLLGCSLCDRNGVGIDLDQGYIEAYKKVCDREKLTQQLTIHGDAREVISLVRGLPEIPEQFDLVLTDPPYGDMMARAQTGEKKKRTGLANATPFTDSEHDLGNLPLDDFLIELRKIIEASVALLKPRGYCVVFCKDLQPTLQHHNMLHADIVEELLKISDLTFKGYKIWYDKTPTLYPFGYPFAFVANQLHQYILIFRKEIEKPVKKIQTQKRKKPVQESVADV